MILHISQGKIVLMERNLVYGENLLRNRGNPREIIPLIRRALEAPSELRHPPMSEQRLSFE